jgi:hypothetical protein
LIDVDIININQQLTGNTLDKFTAFVLIDIPQNGAKLATWWLHGPKSGYMVATWKRGE